MSDVLTVAQMEEQFDSEWILVDEPLTDASLNVRGGRVLCHSKDREEVYRKAVQIRPKRFAVLYTGKMPDGTAIVL